MQRLVHKPPCCGHVAKQCCTVNKQVGSARLQCEYKRSILCSDTVAVSPLAARVTGQSFLLLYPAPWFIAGQLPVVMG